MGETRTLWYVTTFGSITEMPASLTGVAPLLVTLSISVAIFPPATVLRMEALVVKDEYEGSALAPSRSEASARAMAAPRKRRPRAGIMVKDSVSCVGVGKVEAR